MTSNNMHPVPAAQVERAMRLTYLQMMLTAVFTASTGGMFLIGFALALGADNILLGWMTALPQCMVVVQLLAAYFIERGASRKRMTIVAALLSPLGWLLIAAIPFVAPALTPGARIGMLIGVISLVALAAQIANNARGSWIGELIPAERRGRFFGNCILFAGIVGSVFAIGEGRFLDIIRTKGLFAFASLFFFGAIFGIVSAALNFPQPDCPLPTGAAKPAFLSVLRDTLQNRALVMLAIVQAVVAMGNNIVGPFVSAYCLRDVGMSFFGLGLVNAVAAAVMLIFSPLFGKMLDRFGNRPILLLGLLVMAPTGFVWFLIPPGAPERAYTLLPWVHIIAGIGLAAWGVAISAYVYKASKAVGRSIQFALYSMFVILVSAPMPVLGGWLVTTLQQAGWGIDLRLTCYLWIAFMFLAAGIAWHIREPEAVRTRVLVFDYFPSEMARFWGSTLVPLFSSLIRFQLPDRPGPKNNPPDEQ